MATVDEVGAARNGHTGAVIARSAATKQSRAHGRLSRRASI